MTRPAIRRGETYPARLGPVEGSEQAGTRPVVVVSNDSFNAVMPVVTIVPLTSFTAGRRIYPSEVFLERGQAGLRADSVAMCQQVRTIAVSRLGKRMGFLDPNTLESISGGLRVHLAL